MKHVFCLWVLLLLMYGEPGACGAPESRPVVLFIVQQSEHFSRFEKELLFELQMMERYRWTAEEMAFHSPSLPNRIEQVKPRAAAMGCDTVVWVDEISKEQAMIQMLALAPGRFSIKSVEVRRTTQTPPELAIVVDEMLRQTDFETGETRETDGKDDKEKKEALSDAPQPSSLPESRQSEPAPLQRRWGLLQLSGGAEAASFSPLAWMPGAAVEGCVWTRRGFGGCLCAESAWKPHWRVSAVEITGLHLGVGPMVFWYGSPARGGRVFAGPFAGMRPVLQRVTVAPDGFAGESKWYWNGAAELGGRLLVSFAEHWLASVSVSGVVWFRTLTFTRESTSEELFITPRITPCVRLGLLFRF